MGEVRADEGAPAFNNDFFADIDDTTANRFDIGIGVDFRGDFSNSEVTEAIRNNTTDRAGAPHHLTRPDRVREN
jgi:hypothetical protein